MARNTETTINNYLAELLRGKHPVWKDNLHAEQTSVFEDKSGLQPDIIVNAPNAQPIVLETEFLPANTVEKDAVDRLGLTPRSSTNAVEQAIAVRVPTYLRDTLQANLAKEISTASFEYCVLSGESSAPIRWPKSGWLTGTINEIARCVEQALVSQRLVDQSMNILENGVRVASQIIQDDVDTGFTYMEKIGKILNQESGEQTNRMAMTIIANALTFHLAITGSHDIPSLAKLQVDGSRPLHTAILKTWQRILDEINYWPIFKVASDLLKNIRDETAKKILRQLIGVADQLAEHGVNTRHDLSGRMFQTLIDDRKFLATFYTLPTSAALLAELASERLKFNWKDLENYPMLRIADLACGTGTLLSAAYHAVLCRYRRAGGNDIEIHSRMIEQSLIAADIMPAAAHLCASQLSSFHPTKTFSHTRIHTMPYGDGVGEAYHSGPHIGSLDLIYEEQTLSLFPTGYLLARGTQEDVEIKDVHIPHGSIDLMIMNPPFTRPTNHKVTSVPIPSFAGFGTTEDEQIAMSSRLDRIYRYVGERAGNGNAGLASNFIDLAHAKIKPGGVLAFVLPISAAIGSAWAATRRILLKHYSHVSFITIAATEAKDRAFSADTNMAETLVLATKKLHMDDGDIDEVLYVNLHRRPSSLPEAIEVARQINGLKSDSKKGIFRVGDQEIGGYLRARVCDGGIVALRNCTIAEVMITLSNSQLLIPQYRIPTQIPIVPLGQLGNRGLLHRDIGSKTVKSQPDYRGPFTIRLIQGIPNFPILWNHDAKKERCMIVEPDSEGEVRPHCDERAIEVWQTATRLHFTLDFGLSSQSLAACLTANLCIGGRAWPSYKLENINWEEIITLWANSTLGLMSFWWVGSRQHPGRSVLTINRLNQLMVIDPRQFSEDQLKQSKEIFQRFRNAPFLPANEAYRDKNRKALDQEVLFELLGLPKELMEPFDHLREQWCAEPSVHGGKSTAITTVHSTTN